jgi:hypothetical protein
MSIKSKLLAAVTTLTMIGGVAAVAALPARTAAAATRFCGPRCIDFFSRQAGTYRHPGIVLDVLGQRKKAGQPIGGFRASRHDPGEDFVVSFRGKVSELHSAGLVTDWLALRYGGLGCQVYRPASRKCLRYYPDVYAYEIEYAPLGADTGLCVGTPGAARDGTPVSLQPCGASARTVWVVDLAHSVGPRTSHPFAPLINGSESGFTLPYVLTYPGGPRSSGAPWRQLATRTLRLPAHGGTAGASQLWGAGFGVLP